MPGALRASVGAHYRHSLEHFKLLLEAVNGPQIDYDRRERDTGLEKERLFALQVTRDFRHAARFLSTLPADRPIEARYKISYAGSGILFGVHRPSAAKSCTRCPTPSIITR